MKDGTCVTFYHAGGLATGIVNGESWEHQGKTLIPVYMPDTDKQLWVHKENIMSDD